MQGLSQSALFKRGMHEVKKVLAFFFIHCICSHLRLHQADHPRQGQALQCQRTAGHDQCDQQEDVTHRGRERQSLGGRKCDGTSHARPHQNRPLTHAQGLGVKVFQVVSATSLLAPATFNPAVPPFNSRIPLIGAHVSSFKKLRIDVARVRQALFMQTQTFFITFHSRANTRLTVVQERQEGR